MHGPSPAPWLEQTTLPTATLAACAVQAPSHAKKSIRHQGGTFPRRARLSAGVPCAEGVRSKRGARVAFGFCACYLAPQNLRLERPGPPPPHGLVGLVATAAAAPTAAASAAAPRASSFAPAPNVASDPVKLVALLLGRGCFDPGFGRRRLFVVAPAAATTATANPSRPSSPAAQRRRRALPRKWRHEQAGRRGRESEGAAAPAG